VASEANNTAMAPLMPDIEQMCLGWASPPRRQTCIMDEGDLRLLLADVLKPPLSIQAIGSQMSSLKRSILSLCGPALSCPDCR